MGILELVRRSSVLIVTTVSVGMMPLAYSGSSDYGGFGGFGDSEGSGGRTFTNRDGESFTVTQSEPEETPTREDFKDAIQEAEWAEESILSVLELLGIEFDYYSNDNHSSSDDGSSNYDGGSSYGSATDPGDYPGSSNPGSQGSNDSNGGNGSGDVTPPDVVTDDPFEGITDFGDGGSTEIGNPRDADLAYGSVPLIRDDEESVKFLLDKMVEDALENADGGDTGNATSILEETYGPYARELAKTLSKLSQEEQNYVFYGKR